MYDNFGFRTNIIVKFSHPLCMKWLDDGYPRVDLDLVAIKAVLRGRIQYWETVGHIAREISRFCYYFINYGGTSWA